MTNSRQVTSVDVARAAGTSQASVSRTFNGGKVAPETRERILRVAQELGYTPNEIARGLVMNRTGLVGVVIGDVTNPFYPEFLEEVASRLKVAKRHMLLQNAADGDLDDAINLLLQQRVSGIVLTVAKAGSTILPKLLADRFPLVLANRVLSGSYDTVQSDNRVGVAMVVDHLVALGHSKIAMIQGDPGASTSQQRTEGFRVQAKRHGLSVPREYVRETDFTYASAYREATELLALPHPPTAIFCHNDYVAFAALNVAVGRGISVPEQLSIVGFDDVREAGWESINLTTVSQSLVQLAVLSLELLSHRLVHRDAEPQQVVVTPQLVVRGTTGPPRKEDGLTHD